MSTLFSLPTPIGPIGISIFRGQVSAVDFLDQEQAAPAELDPLATEVMRQLQAYFENGSSVFSLPLAPHGTDFQRRVWEAMLGIPVGQVRSYGDIAREIGSGARAVGNACRKNPIPVIIPCHRIVSAQGIGGYSGATEGRKLAIKRWLLTHEGVAL